jgi:hypothetical protein
MDRKEVPWAIYRSSLPRSLWLPVFSPQNHNRSTDNLTVWTKPLISVLALPGTLTLKGNFHVQGV